MILENETFDKFGYNPHNLSYSSNKIIVICCDYCGGHYESIYKNRNTGYKKLPKDACNKCKFKKREEVSLKTYGVKNSSQRDDVLHKLSRYDIDSKRKEIESLLKQSYSVSYIANKLNLPSSSLIRKVKKWGLSIPDKRQSVKKRLSERFGVNYSSIISQKIKRTIKTKYGVDNIFQSKETKEKIKETSKRKYGVPHPAQSIAAKESRKNTVRERYNIDNVFQLESVKSKSKETNINKYGVSYSSQSPEIKSKAKETRIKNGNEKQYLGLSLIEIAEVTGFCRSRMGQLINQYGFETALKMSPKQSSLESAFESLLKNNNITYDKQFNINGKIADFKIGNLLVELDGLYYHSDACLERSRGVNPKTYHYDKKKLYTSLGYDSLFFRSDEIEQKYNIISSVFLNKIGLSKKVQARKCEIKIVSTEDSKVFFNNNHLMGSGRGVSIGLFYNNSLVMCGQFNKLKDNFWDISRMCPLLNTSVVGGYSRILKYFENNYAPKQLRNFVDLRYGSGDYLTDFGFTKESCHPSFRWTDGKQSFHRLKFRGSYGYEKGLFKIWDCGQQKWLKTY